VFKIIVPILSIINSVVLKVSVLVTLQEERKKKKKERMIEKSSVDELWPIWGEAHHANAATPPDLQCYSMRSAPCRAWKSHSSTSCVVGVLISP
jgi:hypothetical protein